MRVDEQEITGRLGNPSFTARQKTCYAQRSLQYFLGEVESHDSSSYNSVPCGWATNMKRALGNKVGRIGLEWFGINGVPRLYFRPQREHSFQITDE